MNGIVASMDTLLKIPNEEFRWGFSSVWYQDSRDSPRDFLFSTEQASTDEVEHVIYSLVRLV